MIRQIEIIATKLAMLFTLNFGDDSGEKVIVSNVLRLASIQHTK